VTIDQEPYPAPQVHYQTPVCHASINWAMAESTKWGLSRYATLIVVLMLHLALFAALLTKSQNRSLPTSTVNSVQLLLLPPVNLPKVRSETRPRRFSGDTVITITPPVLTSLSPSMSPAPASSSDGSGSGVDWAAEARRALHAFEIRNHQPPTNKSISSKPGEDNWWPQAQHHAGERFKTANGDWIVWINANCYQVAGAGPSAYALGALLPQTICQGQPGIAAR
jgi:hypothetical protein